MNNIQYILPGFEKTAKELGFNSKTISKQTNALIDRGIQNISPGVIEEAPNGTLIQYDIYTRLLKDRIIFFGGPVYSEIMNIVIAQILFLEMTDNKKDITIYLNTPGGEVSAGLSCIDVFDYVTPDISTLNVGMCCSMGSVLLSAGAKGKRYSLKRSLVMVHQPSVSGISGKSDEIEVSVQEMQKTKKTLYEILAQNSGQTYEQIVEKSKLDYWMNAEEAKNEGFIDEILIKRK
jgi:ATP-dependent Clp protease protease subunit